MKWVWLQPSVLSRIHAVVQWYSNWTAVILDSCHSHHPPRPAANIHLWCWCQCLWIKSSQEVWHSLYSTCKLHIHHQPASIWHTGSCLCHTDSWEVPTTNVFAGMIVILMVIIKTGGHSFIMQSWVPVIVSYRWAIASFPDPNNPCRSLPVLRRYCKRSSLGLFGSGNKTRWATCRGE